MTLLTKQEKWVFVFLCTTLVSGYLIQYMKQRNMDDPLHIISKTEKKNLNRLQSMPIPAKASRIMKHLI